MRSNCLPNWQRPPGAISRFRIPRVEASGAAKQRLGDLNPYGDDRTYSNNLASISLFNEFKDAHTEARIHH